ncbi:acetyltransferase [Bacillus manliponensis]|uniref:Acetyltransferase n=1 Tax=Bacillus manliponensis TaxID=574376 RepID=A0A073JWH5_9BACI|nr:GNAT family protein [Bacillus manliponensis]KEK18655.1 acetyltransferase [Bacillus manliponensis]
MNISLHPLQMSDAEQLFQFELVNKEFFEETVPPRGDGYYHFENFKAQLKSLLDEQTQGSSYFYLIRNKQNAIVGRINLTDIDISENLGYLGYRIGANYTGNGIAGKALRSLLDQVAQKGIQQIKAQTTTHNIASQKVLENNGFRYIDTDKEEFEISGQKVSFVYYTWQQ